MFPEVSHFSGFSQRFSDLGGFHTRYVPQLSPPCREVISGTTPPCLMTPGAWAPLTAGPEVDRTMRTLVASTGDDSKRRGDGRCWEVTFFGISCWKSLGNHGVIGVSYVS